MSLTHKYLRHISPGAWLPACLILSSCALTTPHENPGLPQALYRAPWLWVEDSGNTVRFADFLGRPLILSMFYGACSNTCPLTLAQMRRLQRELQGKPGNARFILISLDPRHDDPKHLAAYRAMHTLDAGQWRLLSGGEEQTGELARMLGIHRIDDFTHLIHIAKIFAISADGKQIRVVDEQALDQTVRFLSESTNPPRPEPK